MVGNSESGSEPKAKIIMITDKKANLLLIIDKPISSLKCRSDNVLYSPVN